MFGGLGGVGEFTDPDSWFNGVPTNNTSSDVGVFYGFLGGPPNLTVNLSAARSVRGLQFNAPSGLGAAVDFTFTGSKLTLGGDGIDIAPGAGNNQIIHNDVGLAADQIWNLERNLTVNGALSGAGSLFKNGTAMLTLTASNSNANSISIIDGTLLLSGSGRFSDQSDISISGSGTLRMDGMTDAVNGLEGTGTVDLVNGARLVIGNSINNSQGVGTFDGLIQGNGGLSKRGPGTFTFSGDNTYTGDTRVESGILLLDSPFDASSPTGTGEVFVADGGSLGGRGKVSGNLIVLSGGRVFPGGEKVKMVDPTGQLGFNTLTLSIGGTLAIDLGGTDRGVNYDFFEFNSIASISGSLEVDAIPGFTPISGQSFQILGASTLIGEFAGLPHGELVGVFGGTEIFIEYNHTPGNRGVYLIAGRGGDFNANGIVDAADYTVWRDGMGTEYSSGHYAMWKSNFGQVIGHSPGAGEILGVPEPAASSLLVMVLGAIAAIRTTRTRRSAEMFPRP